MSRYRMAVFVWLLSATACSDTLLLLLLLGGVPVVELGSVNLVRLG